MERDQGNSGAPPKMEEISADISNMSLNEKEPSEDSVNPENRQGLLKVLSNAIGFDITAISLPVNLNEPESFLTRLCEGAQYSDLLDKAALCESSTQRLLYVALFALSFYSSAERTGKPFNPLLGETYELADDKRNDFKFIAEQVSHHPPVGACHVTSTYFTFYQSQCLKTKFAGNSLDCSVIGSNHVILHETKEHFKWNFVRTAVNNVIVGKMWLDHYGDFEVVNKTTGEVAKLRMKQCGWFSSGWHEVDGDICDVKGTSVIHIHGKWNEAIYGRLVGPQSLPESPDVESLKQGNLLTKKDEKKLEKLLKKEMKAQEKERKKEAKEFKKSIKKKLTSNEPLWVHTIKPLDPSKLPQGSKYMVDWTAHTLQLAEMSENLEKILPPTDSRLRPDRYALEKGDVKKAAQEKHVLEEKQRDERRKREASGKAWTPRYFKLVKDEDGDDFWEYQGGYWEEREKRIQAKSK